MGVSLLVRLARLSGGWWRLVISLVLLIPAGLVWSAEIAQGQDSPETYELPRVPEGFTIEQVAGPPQVLRPIFAGFDEAGRLYVGESNGDNLSRDELLARKPHWITQLTDTDGDGTFDRSIRFVEHITLPQGALFHQGSLYAVCPPSVWKFTDTDNDGQADEQTEILTRFGFNGNACDTHGPFLSPTGRLVIVQGRHGHEFRDAEGDVYSSGQAGRIYSCNADGSDVRIHAGGGFDNPIEVDFTPGGECIGTVNILYRDRGDCLMHWVEGGVYPRDDLADMVAEFPWTGGLLGPVHNLGHVAVSGIVRYRGEGFGASLQDRWFFTEFNTHKVRYATLKPAGSTFTADVQEFLTSSSPYFHPTDVLQDADGSLLVLDTGAWFLNGCPSSQVSRPELYGGIYRVRKTGVTTAAGTQPRYPIAEQLAPLPADMSKVIARVETLPLGEAPSLVMKQLIDRTWREPLSPELSTRLLVNVQERDLPVVRQFCELAAIRCTNRVTPALTFDGTSLQKLAELALRPDLDRTTEHGLVVALQRQPNVDGVLALLGHDEPAVQRVALIALDDHAANPLTREQVVPLLSSSDTRLQQAALDVITRQPGWGAEVLGLLQQWLAQPELTVAQSTTIRTFLLVQLHDEAVQTCVGEVLVARGTPEATSELLWLVLKQAGLSRWPNPLRDALHAALESPQTSVRWLALQCVTTSAVAGFDAQLNHLANDSGEPIEVRCEAIAALAPRTDVLRNQLWTWLNARLADSSLSAAQQSLAARAIGALKLSDEQLLQLAPRLRGAGPLTLASLVQPFTRGESEEVGLALVAVLGQTDSLTSVGADQLSAVLRRYPASVQLAAEPLFQQLGVDAAAQTARLEELSALLEEEGNLERGRDVFYGRKAACSACHHIRGDGGRIGPELTTIGASRSPRDLLEAVVYPSASFVNGYRTSVVATQQGQVIQGVISSEGVDSITLKTSDLREHRILRSEIEEQREGTISIMPAGLDRQLSPDEFRDLLAFLRHLK